MTRRLIFCEEYEKKKKKKKMLSGHICSEQFKV